MHNLRILFQTNWLKTLYFNFHYLGWYGIHLPVIVSRNFRLKRMKGKVILGNKRKGKVFLGRNDCIHLDGKGIWANEGKITFDDKCFIGNGTKISVLENGHLTFGSEVYITGNSRLVCEHSISIGKQSIISWDVTIMDSDQHSILDEFKHVINNPKAIVIGDKTWIGMGSLLLKGTVLPRETIIAAKSIISKAFTESNCILGNVNEVMKKQIFWEP